MAQVANDYTTGTIAVANEYVAKTLQAVLEANGKWAGASELSTRDFVSQIAQGEKANNREEMEAAVTRRLQGELNLPVTGQMDYKLLKAMVDFNGKQQHESVVDKQLMLDYIRQSDLEKYRATNIPEIKITGKMDENTKKGLSEYGSESVMVENFQSRFIEKHPDAAGMMGWNAQETRDAIKTVRSDYAKNHTLPSPGQTAPEQDLASLKEGWHKIIDKMSPEKQRELEAGLKKRGIEGSVNDLVDRDPQRFAEIMNANPKLAHLVNVAASEDIIKAAEGKTPRAHGGEQVARNNHPGTGGRSNHAERQIGGVQDVNYSTSRPVAHSADDRVEALQEALKKLDSSASLGNNKFGGLTEKAAEAANLDVSDLGHLAGKQVASKEALDAFFEKNKDKIAELEGGAQNREKPELIANGADRNKPDLTKVKLADAHIVPFNPNDTDFKRLESTVNFEKGNLDKMGNLLKDHAALLKGLQGQVAEDVKYVQDVKDGKVSFNVEDIKAHLTQIAQEGKDVQAVSGAYSPSNKTQEAAVGKGS